MQNVFHTYQSFGQSANSANTLVIEYSKQSFYFCELQSDINAPSFITSVVIDIQSTKTLVEQFSLALNHLGFHKKKYEQVWIDVVDEEFTLCPEVLFDVDNARAILEFNCGDSKQKPLLVDDVNPTIKLIYTIDEELKSLFDKLFPQHQFRHRMTLLNRLMLNAEEFSKEDVLVSINEQSISIILKQQQQIVLANQYQIKTNEDVLYYLLFIMEQYQLNPSTVKISLVGNLDATSELISLIKKYIKHWRLAIGHKAINWDALKGMPQHYNFTLINRLFCE